MLNPSKLVLIKIQGALPVPLLVMSCASPTGIPKNIQEFTSSVTSSLNDLDDQPISTSFRDADQTPILSAKFPQKDFKSLLSLQRGSNGVSYYNRVPTSLR